MSCALERWHLPSVNLCLVFICLEAALRQTLISSNIWNFFWPYRGKTPQNFQMISPRNWFGFFGARRKGPPAKLMHMMGILAADLVGDIFPYHTIDTYHGTIAEKIRHHNGGILRTRKCPYTPIFRGLSRRIEWIPPLRLDQPVISTVRWRQEWSFCPQKKGKCHSCHQKICHDWRFCLLCQAQIASTSASSTADTQ